MDQCLLGRKCSQRTPHTTRSSLQLLEYQNCPYRFSILSWSNSSPWAFKTHTSACVPIVLARNGDPCFLDRKVIVSTPLRFRFSSCAKIVDPFIECLTPFLSCVSEEILGITKHMGSWPALFKFNRKRVYDKVSDVRIEKRKWVHTKWIKDQLYLILLDITQPTSFSPFTIFRRCHLRTDKWRVSLASIVCLLLLWHEESFRRTNVATQCGTQYFILWYYWLLSLLQVASQSSDI